MQRFQCNVYTIFPSKPSGNDIFREVSKYISTFRSHTATVFIYSVHFTTKKNITGIHDVKLLVLLMHANCILCEVKKRYFSLWKGPWRPREKERYSFTLSLTSALDGGGWLTSCHGQIYPRERDPAPIDRRLGGSQIRSRRLLKNTPLTEFDLQPSRLWRVAILTTVNLSLPVFFPMQPPY
jgi:hypothetical protein